MAGGNLLLVPTLSQVDKDQMDLEGLQVCPCAKQGSHTPERRRDKPQEELSELPEA